MSRFAGCIYISIEGEREGGRGWGGGGMLIKTCNTCDIEAGNIPGVCIAALVPAAAAAHGTGVDI